MPKLVLLILLLLGLPALCAAQSTPDLRADMCLGDTATMTASVTNADSLQWYKNGLPIFGANNDTLKVLEGGAYSVRAFLGDGKGCFDESGAIRIIINYSRVNDDYVLIPLGKMASIDVLLNDEPICAPFRKSTLQIIAPPTIGRITAIDQGMVQYKPSSTQLGIDHFTYIITDMEGRVTNEATVTLESFVDCAVLFPNPVENTLNVAVDNKRIRLLRLFDAAGRELYKTTVSNPNFTVDMSPYAQGLYIVELVEHDGPGCVIKIQKR